MMDDLLGIMGRWRTGELKLNITNSRFEYQPGFDGSASAFRLNNY